MARGDGDAGVGALPGDGPGDGRRGGDAQIEDVGPDLPEAGRQRVDEGLAAGAGVAPDDDAAGLREVGTDAVDLGVAATPTVARAVAWEGADAGVSVTASHNPPPDNGLKLWQPSGQAYDAAGRARVTERVEGDDPDLRGWDGLGDRERIDADDRHVDALVGSGSSLSMRSVTRARPAAS